MRVDSSNYDPLRFWMSAGVQMVALNYQALDTLPMQVRSGAMLPMKNCTQRHTP